MKCQRNFRVTSQVPHQFICQIEPIRYPRGFPRDMSSIIPVSRGFIDSSGDPSVISSDKPTKYPYPVTIIDPSSVPSETPTKYLSHIQKGVLSAKPSNMLMGYPSGDPTGATSTMSTENPSSKPRSYPISDTDFIKQGIQEVQASLQRYLILFILRIILSLSSSQRVTCMRWLRSMRISRIRVGETRDFLSSTILRIYDKEKCKQVKAILLEIL